MKKLLIAIMLMLLPILAFASDYQIIEAKGQVFLRSAPTVRWQNAHKGDTLSDGYGLKTEENSQCTFAAGDNINKAITLKESSQLTISDDSVRSLLLLKGRVFLLVEKMEAGETFEVRTPTAIAGVRGTGWTVESDQATDVKCFEGEVYVKGVDAQGNAAAQKDVAAGSGVQVKDGAVDEPVVLTRKDKKEWNSFKDVVKDKWNRGIK